ncbi:zinc finger BED domain-containing protein RICESLEEPER 2-like [Senna tora]|uniref:Zinc finger BED domain-containing protein RICESLEEPER 2-like n=1 Tax=Senna tora TaxID=362788 RepID=A0A834VYV6_9FABA|nr:zinc finger BED domain-containing protein RICESLEEPER 2-like [Senna tora]
MDQTDFEELMNVSDGHFGSDKSEGLVKDQSVVTDLTEVATTVGDSSASARPSKKRKGIDLSKPKGESIGSKIENCLLSWGIDRVFTITVDNASSNDTAVAYLKGRIIDWNGHIMKGEHMHVRCCAHILNLVVNDGLKDMHESVYRIRNAVRVKETFSQMYVNYRSFHGHGNVQDTTQPQNMEINHSHVECDNDSFALEFDKVMNEDDDMDNQSEVDLYLMEAREKMTSKFDILNWWKVNFTKYPILGQIARDVLAMPVWDLEDLCVFPQVEVSTGFKILDFVNLTGFAFQWYIGLGKESLRWKQTTIDVQPPMTDREECQYFLKSLKNPHYDLMLVVPFEKFSQLITIGEDINFKTREGHMAPLIGAQLNTVRGKEVPDDSTSLANHLK